MTCVICPKIKLIQIFSQIILLSVTVRLRGVHFVVVQPHIRTCASLPNVHASSATVCMICGECVFFVVHVHTYVCMRPSSCIIYYLL